MWSPVTHGLSLLCSVMVSLGFYLNKNIHVYLITVNRVNNNSVDMSRIRFLEYGDWLLCNRTMDSNAVIIYDQYAVIIWY